MYIRMQCITVQSNESFLHCKNGDVYNTVGRNCKGIVGV